jgi:aspartate-semialdehyde dehydrogenase
VGVLGARGLVGRELLAVLSERHFPVAELRLFGTEESVGEEVDWISDSVLVEHTDPRRVMSCELVFSVAPAAVLESLLPSLREAPTRVIDVSGAFELDSNVPLYLPGWSAPVADPHARWIAIPRGVGVAVGLSLGPLSRAVPLQGLDLVTLESASGHGRAGSEELSVQTISLLNSMGGDDESTTDVFPGPLAFDCLPRVGELLEGGQSTEEVRLAHVLRRLLGQPDLGVEITRIRVPTFSGSLTAVHARFAGELDPAAARRIWKDSAPDVRVLEGPEFPTPRGSLATHDVLVGRLRRGLHPGRLAFAVALDDLRRGSSLSAVLAAEAWLGPR